MKKFLILLLLIIIPLKTMAETKEIHDFEPKYREVYTAYAKAAIQEFYLEKNSDSEHQLQKINFTKPIIITANAKDEFDNNIEVIGVAFPDITVKSYWDFALLELEDGLITSIPYRASIFSDDITTELYHKAQKYFILSH